MSEIVGFLSFQNRLNAQEHEACMRGMIRDGRLRGQTDPNNWIDPAGRVALCGKSIICLGADGAISREGLAEDDRSVLIFEGKIFNAPELAHDLNCQGSFSNSPTDDEILLAALEQWGLERTLSKLNGSFVFAWFNRQDRTLTLARDHAGFRQLYYTLDPDGQGLAFASRFDAVLKSPFTPPPKVDLNALAHYLRLSYFPGTETLFQQVKQLEPGSYLQINADNQLRLARWFEMPRQVEQGFIGEDRALEELEWTLEKAVRQQFEGNRPVGVFLSGGVDSPLISAIARSQLGRGLPAFTISVPGWGQDEGADALRYAKQLGLEQQVIEISGENALGVIDQVIQAQHEPFGDFSIIPSLLLFQHASASVGLSLSGDGGDELFFGYERPFSLLRDGRDFRLPQALRAGMFGLGKLGLIRKKSEVILSRSPEDYYYGVNSRFSQKWLQKIAPDLSALKQAPEFFAFERYQNELDLANYSRYVEYYGQLQRGLKKVEMASARQSLEVSAPLLDRDVVALSLKINPLDMMKDGQRKRLLYKLLGKFVPQEIIPATKRGFGIPLGEWMRGPMRALVEETLFSGGLYPSGLFSQQELNAYWQEHLSGKADHKWGLWNLLCLQWWAARNLDK